ncbi:MAG: hypothetical protein HQ546_04800, partial [Planctomycetes bacterium]|nr:hypothetical protein [Planctomycetota bacterium]
PPPPPSGSGDPFITREAELAVETAVELYGKMATLLEGKKTVADFDAVRAEYEVLAKQAASLDKGRASMFDAAKIPPAIIAGHDKSVQDAKDKYNAALAKLDADARQAVAEAFKSAAAPKEEAPASE